MTLSNLQSFNIECAVEVLNLFGLSTKLGHFRAYIFPDNFGADVSNVKVGDRVAEGITLGKRPYLRPSAGSVKWAAKKGIKKRQHPAPDPEQQETIESMQPEGCHIPEKNKLSETSPGVINLTLTFSGDDKNLYDTLIKRARSARRNPEQQLMAMLDHYLAGGLVKPIYVPK